MIPSAMIFAAGFGTRMGPLTRDLPKPMVPLGGAPMIDHTIKLLRAAGITRIVANTHYLSDRITPHLTAQDVITNHEAGEILDTGGGLRAALPLLGSGPVITINPDALWLGPNPVDTLLDAWREDMQALLLLVEGHHAIGRTGGGDFALTDGQLSRGGPHVYGGAQILRPERLGEIDDAAFSLNRYWDHLAASGPLHGTRHPGRWCDIGTPEGLRLAEEALAHV
ncbi:MAG: nucleotidyltransferase family protein [Silicimonas sp.]|nr:nucleotidyltransferase family protein [Silicimonas sp.]